MKVLSPAELRAHSYSGPLPASAFVYLSGELPLPRSLYNTWVTPHFSGSKGFTLVRQSFDLNAIEWMPPPIAVYAAINHECRASRNHCLNSNFIAGYFIRFDLASDKWTSQEFQSDAVMSGAPPFFARFTCHGPSPSSPRRAVIYVGIPASRYGCASFN